MEANIKQYKALKRCWVAIVASTPVLGWKQPILVHPYIARGNPLNSGSLLGFLLFSCCKWSRKWWFGVKKNTIMMYFLIISTKNGHFWGCFGVRWADFGAENGEFPNFPAISHHPPFYCIYLHFSPCSDFGPSLGHWLLNNQLVLHENWPKKDLNYPKIQGFLSWIAGGISWKVMGTFWVWRWAWRVKNSTEPKRVGFRPKTGGFSLKMGFRPKTVGFSLKMGGFIELGWGRLSHWGRCHGMGERFQWRCRKKLFLFD